MLNVVIINPREVIYQGQAESVKLPGESGAMEILPFHKNLVSRLLAGAIIVDEQDFKIKRGVVKVINNTVTVICELANKV